MLFLCLFLFSRSGVARQLFYRCLFNGHDGFGRFLFAVTEKTEEAALSLFLSGSRGFKFHAVFLGDRVDFDVKRGKR